MLYVLEGVVEVEEGDRATTAGAGACVALRRHVPHRWRVASERARVLITTVPGAFADYFLDPGAGGPWACERARAPGRGPAGFRNPTAARGRTDRPTGPTRPSRGCQGRAGGIGSSA